MSQIIWEPIHEHRDCFKGYSDGFIYVVKSAAPEEKERVQAQHDARVADIAAANGYVRPEPGFVFVKSIDLECLLAMYEKGVEYVDSAEVIERLTAAIEAAKRSSYERINS